MFKEPLGIVLPTIVGSAVLVAGLAISSTMQSFEPLHEAVYSGSVGDGPIVGATITIKDSEGKVLGSEFSDNTANYKMSFKTRSSDYPLLFEANGGVDLVTGYGPSFVLASTALGSSEKHKINLNPFSTLITKTAMAMPGGLNDTNLSETKAVVSRHLSFGLDPVLVADPMTSRIEVDNIADLVKASEGLAEMIRRTRKALMIGGHNLNDNQVIDALAGDLSDGVIDGQGVGADALIAATANIVSGQVLVEALVNRIKVDEAVATQRMDVAIIITKPTATKMTDYVLITEEMLNQTQIAVAATQAITPSPELSDLSTVLTGLQPYSTAAIIEPLLPEQASLLFDQAIQYVVTASDEELEAVNAAVRERVKNEINEPTVTLSVDSTSVSYNGEVTLTWNSTDADSCTASSGWSGTKGLSGSETVGPLTSDSGFVLTCTGIGGEVSDSVAVEVQPPLLPTVTLTADAASVVYNGSVTLNWSSTDADECRASGDWSGAKGTSGSESIASLTADSSFMLSCTGAGGEASATVLIDVQSPPPAVTLTANPASVVYNGTVVLNWSSTDADTCTASGAWTGTKATSGSESIGSLTADSSFVLTCSGAGGEANATVTVDVQPPPLPTVSLTTDVASVEYNGTVTLSWSSTDADNCTASGAWFGAKGTSGRESIGALVSDSSFLLSCSGVGGEASATVTVDVQPPLPPSLTFSADTLSVNYNGEATLNWVATDATECTASGSWSGVRGVSGNESTGPLIGDSSFSLTCTGVGGTVSDTVDILCTNCSTDFQLTLSWDKNPDSVTGYKMYKGATVDTVSKEVSDIPLTTAGFDPEMPSISYHFRDDLNLTLGEEQCFKVKAYNNYGLSDSSEAACTALW